MYLKENLHEKSRTKFKSIHSLKVKNICIICKQIPAIMSYYEKYVDEVFRRYYHFEIKKNIIFLIDDTPMHRVFQKS